MGTASAVVCVADVCQPLWRKMHKPFDPEGREFTSRWSNPRSHGAAAEGVSALTLIPVLLPHTRSKTGTGAR